jgi:hypothetical protein|tara:strand:+ start:4413 stop:4598 length:186 start_codon:yes stop_codon:yes gene_type:complete
MIKGVINNKGTDYQYSIDIEEEDYINIYVKQWVLEWCKKYHPEAFKEADQFVKELIKNEKR